MVGKVSVNMGDNSVKIVESKLILKPHAHLRIIGRKSSKFKVNSIKDVVGVVEIRSLGRTDGRTDEWTDGRNNAHTDGQGSFR